MLTPPFCLTPSNFCLLLFAFCHPLLPFAFCLGPDRNYINHEHQEALWKASTPFDFVPVPGTALRP
ncbi:MAG: hypothetical protein EA364_15105 [Balneolaceae bacterium]|nr:MAG: hypothetical protein EA364_15105 [Balneolaceae bacterium]